MNARTAALSLSSGLRSASRRPVPTFTRSFPPPPRTSAAGRPTTFYFSNQFRSASNQSSNPGRSDDSAGSSKRGQNASFRNQFILSAVLATVLTVGYNFARSRELHLEAAPQTPTLLPISTAQSNDQVVIDPDTQQTFPLYLPALKAGGVDGQAGRLKLVGLGVRTVSFLRVRVYVAALYIDERALTSFVSGGGFNAEQTLEQNIQRLLDQDSTRTAAVIRIVPVRSTDFNHLRDGFIRALQNRLKKATKLGLVESGSDQEKNFSEAIQHIKDSFPRGSVPKGSALDLLILPSKTPKTSGSTLSFQYDGQVFGQVDARSGNITPQGSRDPKFTVARELVLAYFAEKGEISTPFKKSVQEGFNNLLQSSA